MRRGKRSNDRGMASEKGRLKSVGSFGASRKRQGFHAGRIQDLADELANYLFVIYD
jgi:hypothetical protein